MLFNIKLTNVNMLLKVGLRTNLTIKELFGIDNNLINLQK